MYLFDASSLREDLIQNQVSERDFAIYAFLVAGVAVPFYVTERIDPASVSISPNFLSSIAYLIIGAIGTRACYLANGGRDGKDFLDRFISFGWVIGVRVFLAALLPLGVLAVVVHTMKSPILENWIIHLTMVAINALYFWRLSVHVRMTRERERAAA